MNQPSSACALALDSSKAASRLFRPRHALYGIVAISIAGAASAPSFVVQRAHQDKQSRQEADRPAGQHTTLALAAAHAEPAPPAVQPEPASAVAPVAGKTAQTITVPIKRALPIPRKVAGASFKPQKVAAWLPDPASYVARNSDADGQAPLPAIAVERSPAASNPEADTQAIAAANTQANTAADTQAVVTVDTQVFVAADTQAPAAADPQAVVAADTQAVVVAADTQVPAAASTQADTATDIASNTASNTEAITATDTALASVAVSDTEQADSAGPITVVAAARPGKDSEPAARDEHLVLHLQADEDQRANLPPVPAQATAEGEEQVVIVATAPAQLRDQPAAPRLAQAEGADVVVVSTARNETVNLDAELRGLSLAMSTRLGAPQATLARAPELPNWAVMGEGKKLRLSR